MAVTVIQPTDTVASSRAVINANFADLALGLSVIISSSALPTPAAPIRGQLYIKTGGAGVADQMYVCVKKADDTYAWLQPAVTP